MRSLLGTTLVAFALAAAIQRGGLFALRWAPNRHTWAALGAAVLPALFSTVALFLPRGSTAFNLVLWVLIFGLCGLLCHSLFATTYNLLVIWPLFFTAGVLHDFIANLGLPEFIGRSLGWPLLGWALAIGVPTLLWLASPARAARWQEAHQRS